MLRPSYSALAQSSLGLTSTDMVVVAEEGYVAVDHFASLPNSDLQVFRDGPPLPSEIDQVIERVAGALMQQQGYLFSVQPSQLEIVSNRVFALLSTTESRIQILDSLSVMSLSNPEFSPKTLEWSYLKDNFPCKLCGDVLAAPCLSNCLHSFCGMCLQAKSKISTFCCPECGSSVGTCSLYERNLAEQLESLVRSSINCAEKSKWVSRNDQYKEYRVQEESKTIEQMAESSFSFEDFARDNMIPIAVLCLFAVEVYRRI